MDSRIAVERVWLSENGRRINYAYRATGRAAALFAGQPLFYARYDCDLTEVPESLLMVPLVANLAPISWFAGVPLDVPVLDARFMVALQGIKDVFLKDYPALCADHSPLMVAQVVEVRLTGAKRAMLFSGGVDAYATYFRHRSENPELVSIHGADIPVADERQWRNLVQITAAEPLLRGHPKRHIEANLRDFYTYRVNFLVPSNAWWGTVQHGLALNGLVAPLACVHGYATSYIASSYTEAIQILWGSAPTIDNRIAWSGCQVMHDGYELRRIDKISCIVRETSASLEKVKLRVCYSELNDGLNCSNCEKCFRTMLGLSLFGANPNDYGFRADSSAYARILAFVRGGFKTVGSRYFWGELHQAMLSSKEFFLFSPKDAGMRNDIESALGDALGRPLPVPTGSMMKAAAIARFPKAFALYLKARRILS